MSRYVAGFVIPIKKKNLASYRKMARLGCRVWMKHGALDYYECIGDDIKKTWGMPFTKLCKLKRDETVVFAFIVYKSKAHRKQVDAKVMKDPAMQPGPNMKMPFEQKRFVMGGFKVVVRG